MFGPCSSLWGEDRVAPSSSSRDKLGPNPICPAPRHWSSHFGQSRLEPLTVVKHDHAWAHDHILCPISLQHERFKPHAAQLIPSHENPVQLGIVQPHHMASQPFIYLHPDTKTDLFCLTLVYQNTVFYLGIEGITRSPQYVAVWKWNLICPPEDEISSGDEQDQKKKRLSEARNNSDQVSNRLIITDPSDQWILQRQGTTLQFAERIRPHLFDAVFLSAPPRSFIDAYQSR